MIKKFFLTERKGYLVLCIAGLVLCLIAALGFSFAGIGATDATRARLAEKAFASFTLISYIIPLAVLLMSFFTYRKCYRTAGLTESQIAYGILFNVFIWTTMFLVAQMLFVTLFDFLYYIGGAAVRGQTQQRFMLLSLRAHGVLRLLFAPSVGVSVSLLYAMYDMVRIAIRRPHMILWKILIGIVVVGVFVIYQSAIYYAMTQTGSFADASWLVNPDSILPLAGLASMSMDFVKDTHLLSAPIFNLIYLVSEAGFVLFAYGFSKLYGRCQNDDDWS